MRIGTGPRGAPLLRVAGLVKRFGGAVALDGVDLSVERGEVHGLVGENGAGKSTLIKCLAGVHRADAGAIEWEGRAAAPVSPREAAAMGVAVIHQELQAVPGFTAAEMLTLGRPYPTRWGLVDRRAMRERAREACREIAPELPLDTPLRAMPAGQRQLVEVVRALAQDARLLILDEPTAALSQGEADRLHAALGRLAAGGAAVLYVSHRLGDVLAQCARVTVLRGGRTVAEGEGASLRAADLVRHMSGRDAPRRGSPQPPRLGAVVLRIDALPFGPEDRPLSLDVREGEVVALYGLIGAGRSGLLRCVWGASRPRAPGRIALAGEPLGGGVRGRIARGVAYVPEERLGEGLVGHHSVLDNAALPHLGRLRAARGLPVPSRRRALGFLGAVRERLDVRLGSPDAPIASLSGGNQQKVLVGRWTSMPLRLLILDEPTRGVDVGAKARLHDDVRRLAAEGAAVLLASSDVEEALGLATRVVVMARGRVVEAFAAREADPARVLRAAFAEAPDAVA